jgi:hypothetical protein
MGGIKTADVLKQRTEWVEQRYQTALKEISSLSRQNTDPLFSLNNYNATRAAYAFSWAEMRCQRNGNHLDDMLYDNKISTIMYGSIGSRNSSNLCDQRVDLEIVSGYLARRYQYKGEKICMQMF